MKVHPAARREIAEAGAWYAERSELAGKSFRLAVADLRFARRAGSTSPRAKPSSTATSAPPWRAAFLGGNGRRVRLDAYEFEALMIGIG